MMNTNKYSVEIMTIDHITEHINESPEKAS